VAGESVAQPSDDAPGQVFDLVRRAAVAYGRADLAAAVDAAAQRYAQPHVRVVVVGEFKKGKSTLVNALLGADVCPTDDDVPTTVPTVVHHAATPVAVALHQRGGDGLARELIAPEQVAGVVTGLAGPADPPVAVELGMPRRLLGLGLQVMDTPGVGGLVSAHAAASLAAAASADAVLFVTDALQELTAPELDTLRSVSQRCPAVAVAMTKVDIAPSWRQVMARNEAHLAAAGLRLRVMPLAAPLRRRALAAGDAELSKEAGYDVLVAWLTALAKSRDVLMGRMARAELRRLVALVEQPLATEHEVLDDPHRHDEIVGRLQRAQERAERLKTDAAGWQQLLGDRVADLNSTIDHELRRRLREATRESEQRLEDTDPAEIWDEFEPWLRRRTAEDVGAVVADLQDRAADVVREVLERFADEEGLGEAGVPLDADVLDHPLSTLGALDVGGAAKESPGVIATGLTALRGIQGGVLMFGMVGNLIGLTIAGPVLIGIGVVMGGRSLLEERRRQLTARRQQARQGVRTYLDDVSFHVGKDVRDALRLLQRGLRDHLTERAATVQRSVAEALEAAKQAVAAERASTEQRRTDLVAELARLQRLRDEIDTAFVPRDAS
jgi:hypothetical protein